MIGSIKKNIFFVVPILVLSIHGESHGNLFFPDRGAHEIVPIGVVPVMMPPMKKKNVSGGLDVQNIPFKKTKTVGHGIGRSIRGSGGLDVHNLPPDKIEIIRSGINGTSLRGISTFPQKR